MTNYLDRKSLLKIFDLIPDNISGGAVKLAVVSKIIDALKEMGWSDTRGLHQTKRIKQLGYLNLDEQARIECGECQGSGEVRLRHGRYKKLEIYGEIYGPCPNCNGSGYILLWKEKDGICNHLTWREWHKILEKYAFYAYGLVWEGITYKPSNTLHITDKYGYSIEPVTLPDGSRIVKGE